MKGTRNFIIVIAALCAPGLSARGLNDVTERLGALKDYRSEAKVTVQLPQGDDVNYELTLYSTPALSDTLSCADYLIEWKIPGNDSSEGFTAYFDGNLYRFSDSRLTEYHFLWDSVPFLLGNGRSAVQNNAQFIGYTPAKIAGQLREIMADGNWKYTFSADSVFNGAKADILEAEYSRNGYTGKKLTLVLDPATSVPVYYESENNPTTISEQIITVEYSGAGSEPFPVADEEELIARYPDIFEQFRESNFTVETLRGRPLPTFSLPTLTGERYSYAKGDGFNTPMVILFIDPAVSTASETVAQVRRGISMLPQGASLTVVSKSSDIDGAEAVTGSPAAGENLLMSGRSLARDCGVTSYPTVIFAGKDGKVRDVCIGFNNNLSDIVIEKMTLMQ